MPSVQGSSYFASQGGTGPTGPQGSAGPAGPTGLVGIGTTGNFGTTGSNLKGATLDDNHYLVQTFTGGHDGNSGDSFTYTTTTPIRGKLGESYIHITHGNTYDSLPLHTIGGIGVGVADAHDRIKVRTLRGLGSVNITTYPNGITLEYDRGSFGAINVTGGGEVGRLVGLTGPQGTNDKMLQGMSGGKYIEGSGLLDVQIRNFTENAIHYKFEDNVSGDGFSGGIQLVSGGIDGVTGFWVDIDPTVAKVFVVNASDNLAGNSADGQEGHASPVLFNILNTIPTTELSAFTLVTHGVTGTTPAWDRFSPNVRFPLGIEPCFSGKTDIIDFYSYPKSDGNVWYGNVIRWNSSNDVVNVYGCNEVDAYNSTTEGYRDRRSSQSSGGTGACCLGGNCSHTSQELCIGYFYGAGTTCGYTGNSGNTGNICFGRGSCCIKDETTNKISCYDNVTSDDCVSMGSVNGTVTVYGGDNTLCGLQNCSYAFDDIGACCDGMGGCSIISEEKCKKQNGFFMGYGKLCKDVDGDNICSGGTGACCRSTSCEEDVYFSDCLGTGDVFGGKDTTCAKINCPTIGMQTANCLSTISGLDLNPGDLYAGGVVVGMYRPKGSVCLGATAFGGDRNTSWEHLMEGGTGNTGDSFGMTSDFYYSRYDYHGYGFDNTNTCMDISSKNNQDENSPDSYIMIASLEPIAITGDREIVSLFDHPGATSEFFWSNNGSSWGPLYDTNSSTYDDLNEAYKKNVLQHKEGFWYNANATESANKKTLGLNTFSSCDYAYRNGSDGIEKLLTDRPFSAHGNWMRNWGMYNTIRMISADNALYADYNDVGGYYSSSDFGTGLTSDYVSAIRATRLLSDGLTSDIQQGSTGNIENISGWYLPSHDELGFLAANCAIDESTPDGFNLNVSMMLSGGLPFDGWHWSSTGTFTLDEDGYDTSSTEGVLTTSGGITAGSVAWAINFGLNNNKDYFKSGKKKRTQNTYKVRPIRMIRCDGQHVTGGAITDNKKLWNIPKVLRDEDKGINQ
jgi:hypothetical protein